MIVNLLTKLFGSKNERELNKVQPVVERINALEPEIQAFSDDQLKARTALFKERIEKGSAEIPIDKDSLISRESRFQGQKCLPIEGHEVLEYLVIGLK